MRSLRLINLAEACAEEEARLAALDTSTAAHTLLAALRVLADEEAERLEIPFVDPTYHGCDPAWRDVLRAAGDLRHTLNR